MSHQDGSSSKEDQEFINIPPLSGTEEDVMEAERVVPPGKDKGLQQSELFDTQKLINGSKPQPTKVKQFSQRFGYYISNYSERKQDGKVYIKVDGALHLIASILFNDDNEHQFRILARMCKMTKEEMIPPESEEWIKSKYMESLTHSDSRKPFKDWRFAKEVANHFPDTFLKILQNVFPLAASTAVQADVTKAILNLKIRFDLTIVGHNEAQLDR